MRRRVLKVVSALFTCRGRPVAHKGAGLLSSHRAVSNLFSVAAE